MARGTVNEITPWRRRSLVIPPDSWRAWIHLAVWEAWMGMLLFGCFAFGISLIGSSTDQIVTFVDLSRLLRAAASGTAVRADHYRVGALNAAFTALGGLLSLVAASCLSGSCGVRLRRNRSPMIS